MRIILFQYFQPLVGWIHGCESCRNGEWTVFACLLPHLAEASWGATSCAASGVLRRGWWEIKKRYTLKGKLGPSGIWLLRWRGSNNSAWSVSLFIHSKKRSVWWGQKCKVSAFCWEHGKWDIFQISLCCSQREEYQGWTPADVPLS